MKKIFLSSFFNKLSALAVKKDLGKLKDVMDYRQFGGAPLLGVNGHVLKAHGSSAVSYTHLTLPTILRV